MTATPQDRLNGSNKSCSSQSPRTPLNAPPTSSASTRRANIFFSLLTLTIGAIAGAYLTSHLLESEYQQILSQLRSNYQISITQHQDQHKTCHEQLVDYKQNSQAANSINDDIEVQTCRDELKLLKSQWRNDQMNCQQEMEREMIATHRAYEDANAAITKASNKLNLLKQESNSLTAQLDQRRRQLEEVSTDLETTSDQWNQAKAQLIQTATQLEETNTQLTQTRNEMESVTIQKNQVQNQLQQTQSQLSTASNHLAETQAELNSLAKEIQHRDIERAECDKTHHDLITCQRSLDPSSPDDNDATTTNDKCPSSLKYLKAEKADMLRRMDLIKSQKDKAVEESEFMKRRGSHLEKQLENLNSLVGEFEEERDGLKNERDGLVDMIRFRDRNSVLDRYGPGPHRIEITIQLPTATPTEESLILELAPLDLMPHTIKTFLDMIEHNIYIDGTFMFAKSHIVLAGPVDYHNDDNDKRLSERLAINGYVGGALMLNEYTSEYPHVEGTVGFAAASLGPVFYINLIDNSENHGRTKDVCFGKFVKGYDLIQRIAHMPKLDDDGVFELPIYIVRMEVVN